MKTFSLALIVVLALSSPVFAKSLLITPPVAPKSTHMIVDPRVPATKTLNH